MPVLPLGSPAHARAHANPSCTQPVDARKGHCSHCKTTLLAAPSASSPLVLSSGLTSTEERSLAEKETLIRTRFLADLSSHHRALRALSDSDPLKAQGLAEVAWIQTHTLFLPSARSYARTLAHVAAEAGPRSSLVLSGPAHASFAALPSSFVARQSLRVSAAADSSLRPGWTSFDSWLDKAMLLTDEGSLGAFSAPEGSLRALFEHAAFESYKITLDTPSGPVTSWIAPPEVNDDELHEFDLTMDDIAIDEVTERWAPPVGVHPLLARLNEASRRVRSVRH